jgi:hypothetical protein
VPHAAVHARPPRIAALALSAFLLLASGASASTIDVPAQLGSALGKAQRSGLVVLLPSKMNLDYKAGGKLYAAGSGSAKRHSYDLSLSGAKNCGGATACFLADFSASKGAPLGFTTNVKLALGMKGHYKPLSCGGSCSPPSIQWVQKGVRYEIQANALGGRSAFVSMANSAIRAGNRKE